LIIPAWGLRLKLQIDINCDLGESYGAFKVGNDEKIMPHITSANIACGFHAGDPMTMAQTVNLAKRYNVAIGAHPSYPDLLGFGRREMKLTWEEARDYTIYQISALNGFARAVGVHLQHLKPHGALYNAAEKDEELSDAIAEAVRLSDPSLIIFAPPKSMLAKICLDAGLRVAHEVFADRAYDAEGSLVSRKQPNAIIAAPSNVVKRAIRMVKEGTVVAVDRGVVNLGEAHTICVHGDTQTAALLAKALRRGLTKAGIEVKPVGSFI
jgi:UPF0271 protein